MIIRREWRIDKFEIDQSATRVYPKMITHVSKKENESSHKISQDEIHKM